MHILPNTDAFDVLPVRAERPGYQMAHRITNSRLRDNMPEEWLEHRSTAAYKASIELDGASKADVSTLSSR